MSTALEVVSLIGELMSKQILSCNMNPALILHSRTASIQKNPVAAISQAQEHKNNDGHVQIFPP
jgi:hypothetical protein